MLALLARLQVLEVLVALLMQTLVLLEQRLAPEQRLALEQRLAPEQRLALVQVLLTLPRTLCHRLDDQLRRALAVLPFFSVRHF